MNVTLQIPDDLAARLSSSGNLEQQALEALAVEAYRFGRLTKPELRKLLGFATRAELDQVLKAHEIYESLTAADIERERADVLRLGF